MYYQDQKNPFKKAVDNFLRELIKNKEVLIKNPGYLSTVMKEYNLLDIAGRYHPEEFLDACDNPKYPFEVVKPKAFNDLVFEAWGHWVRIEEDFRRSGKPRPKTRLENIENKTFPQWMKMFGDKKCHMSNCFDGKWPVYHFLFNMIGNGIEWNQDGFLRDSSIKAHSKFSKAEALPKSLQKITSFKKMKEYKDGIKIYKDGIKKHHKTYKFLLDNIEKQPNPEKIIQEVLEIAKETNKGKVDPKIEKHFKSYLTFSDTLKQAYSHIHPLRKDYANLLTMPKNAHPSYIKAGKEWAQYLIERKATDEESRELAQKFIKKYS